jgi:hypothetical protein
MSGMELLTFLLSGLLGIISPVGTVADSVAESVVRDRLHAAEQLAIRIDNAPTHQVLSGRVDKIRFAGRGLFPIDDIRIALFDLETDEIDLDAKRLQRGKITLEKPLHAGVHLIVTQDDMNRALQSEAIANQLKTLSIGAIGDSAQLLERYDFVNPKVEFLANNRLRFRVILKPQSAASQSMTSQSMTSQSAASQSATRQPELDSEREHPIFSSGGGGGPRHSKKWGECADIAGAKYPQHQRFK